jgi:hypothetical protein
MDSPRRSTMNSLDLSQRARQVSFWAAVTATAAGLPYFAAIALYVAAGFSGMPPTGTRLLAAASDLVFAPAIVILIASLSSQARTTARLAARLSLVILLGFAGLILVLRTLDLMIIAGWAPAGGQLEMYAANTPASNAIMFAWGPAIGLGVILASRLFVGGGVAAWVRRLFVWWGILAIAGWILTILDTMIGASSASLIVGAAAVRVTSYMFPVLATALAAWLLRGGAYVQDRLRTRPASG